MHSNTKPISRDQAAHEIAAGRGFLLWIAAYLVLSLAFLISDQPRAHRVIASHQGEKAPATKPISGPNIIAPGQPPPIAHGS